jgi:hypothetical protein
MLNRGRLLYKGCLPSVMNKQNTQARKNVFHR